MALEISLNMAFLAVCRIQIGVFGKESYVYTKSDSESLCD